MATQTLKIAEFDTPPTAKGQATRNRLLLAAEDVFGCKGFEQARVADIVSVAGVSHGLFYRHFPDKEAILYQVLVRLNNRLRHTSGRKSSDDALPTLAQLEARNILFFKEYREHRLLFRVSREAAARNESAGFRELWLGIRGRFVERTERWIAVLITKQKIPPLEDVRMIAEGLSAMTEQLAYVKVGLANEDPDDAEIERLGKSCGLIWYRTVFGQPE